MRPPNIRSLASMRLNMDYTHRFEAVVLHVMAILLMMILAFAAFWLWFSMIETLINGTKYEIKDTYDLSASFQRAMAGIFVVLIGIELLETIRTYKAHRRFRLEIVLVVGAIAVARHVIQMDFHHVTGMFMAGMGALIFSLVAGFYLLQHVAKKDPVPEDESLNVHVKTK